MSRKSNCLQLVNYFEIVLLQQRSWVSFDSILFSLVSFLFFYGCIWIKYLVWENKKVNEFNCSNYCFLSLILNFFWSPNHWYKHNLIFLSFFVFHWSNKNYKKLKSSGRFTIVSFFNKFWKSENVIFLPLRWVSFEKIIRGNC